VDVAQLDHAVIVQFSTLTDSRVHFSPLQSADGATEEAADRNNGQYADLPSICLHFSTGALRGPRRYAFLGAKFLDHCEWPLSCSIWTFFSLATHFCFDTARFNDILSARFFSIIWTMQQATTPDFVFDLRF